MDRFVLHSDFKPMGDQPQAIEVLAKGFEENIYNGEPYTECSETDTYYKP